MLQTKCTSTYVSSVVHFNNLFIFAYYVRTPIQRNRNDLVMYSLMQFFYSSQLYVSWHAQFI